MEAARLAEAEDLARLGELARQAIAELAPQRGGAVWRRRDARNEPVEDDLAAAIAETGAGGARLVLVGTIVDIPVGYGVVRCVDLDDGGHLAVIEDLYVELGARGVGVGEAMMDLIIEWAQDRRCIGVDAVALPGNRETKNFFESFGLVARAIVVHRPLAQAPMP